MAGLKIVLTLFLYGFCQAAYLTPPVSPPDPADVALMARYIMHYSDWVSLATISTHDPIKGYPFVALKSMSDGIMASSTGIPYLYLTSMDVSGEDIEADTRVTLMATLAQSDYCRTQDFDPQDPQCAKVMMSGTFVKVNTTSEEYQFGQNCLFDRHPAMKTWPDEHQFYVAKVDPIQIDVLDFYGGIKHVSKEDYFNANVTSILNKFVALSRISVIQIN